MKDRDFYLDNAKFILIFLVVLGHYCGNYLNSKILIGLYDVIYSFHMPAFILLSGFLSKNIKQQRFKDVDTILLPYIVIQIIFILYKKFLGVHQDWTIAIPIDSNWYLLGLFIWRMLIPYFNYLKYPVTTSIIVALVIGFFNDFGEYLDLERIIAFFPYFVIGYFFPNNYRAYIFKIKTFLMRFAIPSIIVLFFFTLIYSFPGIGSFIRKCFIPSAGYSIWFGKYGDYGIIFRTLSYLCSLSIAYTFFTLVPARKTWFSEMGARTMNVYVFHLFFIYLIGIYIHYHKGLSELLAFPVAAVITFILSSKTLAPFLENVINLHHTIYHGITTISDHLNKRTHLHHG